MSQLWANNASATLTNDVLASDISIVLDTITNFPVISHAGDYFYATLANKVDTVWEIVKVIATTSNTFTITRAQDNTNAVDWPRQSLFEIRPIAQNFRDFETAVISSTNTLLSTALSTGLLEGGNITVNASDNTKLDISAGTGIIVNNYLDALHPVRTLVSWPTTYGIVDPYLTLETLSTIGIDATGTFFFSPSNFTSDQYKDYILLGYSVHPTFDFQSTPAISPLIAYDTNKTLIDFLTSFGNFNIFGNVYYAPDSTLAIAKSAGSTFNAGANYVINSKSPNIINDDAQNPSPFLYSYRNGTGGWNNIDPLIEINPNNYDDGSGTLALVPDNKWTIQQIFYFSGNYNISGIVYGQRYYDTIIDAENAKNDSIELPSIINNGTFRGWLIVKQGTTNLSDASNAIFIQASKFGLSSVAASSIGGEINTTTNAGTLGTGIVLPKVGTMFPFKSIAAGSSGIAVSNDTIHNAVIIDIASSQSGITSLGTLSSLVVNGLGSFKSLNVFGVGTPQTFLPALINSYDTSAGSIQNCIQNLGVAIDSSSDWIATADTGTSSTNYIDMGINNSSYNDPTWTVNGALDGYLYTSSSSLAIGTAASNGSVVLFAGGTLNTDVVILLNKDTTTISNAAYLNSTLQVSGQSKFETTIIRTGAGVVSVFENLMFQAYDAQNSYIQNNIQNLSPDNAASCDFVATSDVGDDSSGYIDMGINCSGWDQAYWTVSSALDGYVFCNSGNLAVGTDTATKNIILFTGGTLAENSRVVISDTGASFSVPITGALNFSNLTNLPSTLSGHGITPGSSDYSSYYLGILATAADSNKLGGVFAVNYLTSATAALTYLTITSASFTYLGITAMAADSAKLGGVSAASYATQSWISSQSYLTGITSSQITTALGFTPLNAIAQAVDSAKLGGTLAASYLLSATASSTYLGISSQAADSAKLGGTLAASYLLSATASSTYLTILNASSTYLPSTTAASLYLPIATAALTYLGISAQAADSAKLGGVNASSYALASSIPTVPTVYTSNPAMDGAASPGNSGQWSDGNHIHPTDTSRASKSFAIAMAIAMS